MRSNLISFVTILGLKTIMTSATETTTTTTNSSSPNHSTSSVVDCDCFLLKLVDSYLKLKGLQTQRIEAVVKDKTISHPFDCLCRLGFTENLSHSLSVQLEKDEPMHSQHFSKFGNVFDPSFPNNKLKLYLCGIFAIDPKNFHPSSRLNSDTGKLSGAVIFNFLVVLCSIAEKIFTTFPDKPLREREDVIIACIHTADYFKNSILIPDWLLKHGGWTALAKVAEKIALTTQNESSSNWRDMLPGAAVLASGMAALGIAVIARR